MHRILFVSHSSYWGGGEKCLYLLLKGLPRDEFEPLVLLPPTGTGEIGALGPAVEALGIETVEGPLVSWVRPWSDRLRSYDFAEVVAATVDLIRSRRVDIVFSNTSVVLGGALAARICKVPHVWHVLEMLTSDPALRPTIGLREFYLLMEQLADRIIAGSSSVEADIRQSNASARIEVIHTGIEPRDESELERRKAVVFGVPEDTFVISFVGDLSERKGVADLIRCAPQVLAKHPGAKFMVAGRDGGRGEVTRREIAAAGLTDAIQLLGFRSDAENIIAASDLFVLPTLSDPLPLVVQEAMSVGTPVIATLSGGCADMVVDGETGHLVPVQDPDALAAAVIGLMDSPQQRTRMGNLGRERLESHFSHQDYVRKMSDLFTEVLSEEAASSVHLNSADLLELLVQCLDSCSARHGLDQWNDDLLRTHDAIENSFSTRLGRTLTSPWRGIRRLLGRV